MDIEKKSISIIYINKNDKLMPSARVCHFVCNYLMYGQ
jgi:hypothetical protein